MPREQLKAKDKIVLKMTRDGAVAENLTEGTSEKISSRLEDARLLKQETDHAQFPSREEVHLRHQQSVLPVAPSEKPQTETPGTDAPEVRSAASSGAGSAAAGTVISHKIRTAPVARNANAERAQGSGASRLLFEDALQKPKRQSKLQFEAAQTAAKVGDTLAFGLHGKIHEAEQENAAVEAAHRSEILAESAARHYSHHRQAQPHKPVEKASKLEQEPQSSSTKLHHEKTQPVDPGMKSSRRDMNKYYQRAAIKREYAAARNAGSQTAAAASAVTGKKTRERIAEQAQAFAARNARVFVWIGLGLMLLVLLAAGIGSCTAMCTAAGQSILFSSYLSEDDAMLGAEAQYCAMEAALQDYLDQYLRTHDYDEYYFDLADIEHDPYVLISILSVLHQGSFTLAEVQSTLDTLFEQQYILTEEIEEEARIGLHTVTDEETGATCEVYGPYTYYVCTVTLENFDLSHLPVYIMTQEQLSMYAAYMSVLGNREDLFPDSDYVEKYITNPPGEYEVSAASLSDETFAALLAEAEKYLNYPYVWGGSSPETSFDCSGFVCYVLTNSGLVRTGRLSAQGLYNICTPVSSANAKPGDLVFFVGTYDTPGISHVGIYVGDDTMLHCGDPIQYTSMNTSYWQAHFYAFGRPAY